MNTRAALPQLAADKRTRESKIRDLIAKEVADFQMVTGASITGIDVRMVAFEYIGAPSEHRVSGVTVGLALG